MIENVRRDNNTVDAHHLLLYIRAQIVLCTIEHHYPMMIRLSLNVDIHDDVSVKKTMP